MLSNLLRDLRWRVFGVAGVIALMSGGVGLASSPVADAAVASPGVLQGFGTNTGGFTGGQGSQVVVGPGGGNPACEGTFVLPDANVSFQTVSLGSNNYKLIWSLQLNATAQAYLGPIVTGNMTVAGVNGYLINPPYSPHTELANYDFHSSMSTYQRIGSSYIGTLHADDMVDFGWAFKSVFDPNRGAYADTSCQILPSS